MIQTGICAASVAGRLGLVSLVASDTIGIAVQVAGVEDLNPELCAGLDVLLMEVQVLDRPLVATLLDLAKADTLPGILMLLGACDSGLLRQLWGLGTMGVLPATVLSEGGEGVKCAIATLHLGLNVIHPDYSTALLGATAQGLSPSTLVPLSEPLSTREVEVLNRLAQGLSNKAIAQDLYISEHTVKFHISALFAKLNASTRTEAVTLGMKQGLILL
jgi:two-component system, NarL family, response regulator YdfI